LEVVTGSGEIVRCSEQSETQLFDAVRGGMGKFGIITRARIKLRPASPSVRTYYLLYDDLNSLMEDLCELMDCPKVSYLESWCSPCPQGFRETPSGRQPFAQWFFPLHVSTEFRPEDEPDDSRVLDLVKPFKRIHKEDLPIAAFARRMESLFDLWKQGSYWSFSHPWMETILPWDSASGYIEQVLSQFPPHLLGGGHMLLWPARKSASDLPLFMTPESEKLLGYGILPGVPPSAWPKIEPLLKSLSQSSLAVGGKRYLSGWLPFTEEGWKDHYGEKWQEVCNLKESFDPCGIFGGPEIK
jgi:cytokinin dehydrogenase